MEQNPGFYAALVTEDAAFDVFVIVFLGGLAALTLGMLAVGGGTGHESRGFT